MKRYSDDRTTKGRLFATEGNKDGGEDVIEMAGSIFLFTRKKVNNATL